jgi:hypothetical protein
MIEPINYQLARKAQEAIERANGKTCRVAPSNPSRIYEPCEESKFRLVQENPNSYRVEFAGPQMPLFFSWLRERQYVWELYTFIESDSEFLARMAFEDIVKELKQPKFQKSIIAQC